MQTFTPPFDGAFSPMRTPRWRFDADTRCLTFRWWTFHTRDALTPETLPGLFSFPADMSRVPAEVNQLNNQVLVSYYEREWRRWN